MLEGATRIGSKCQSDSISQRLATHGQSPTRPESNLEKTVRNICHFLSTQPTAHFSLSHAQFTPSIRSNSFDEWTVRFIKTTILYGMVQKLSPALMPLKCHSHSTLGITYFLWVGSDNGSDSFLQLMMVVEDMLFQSCDCMKEKRCWSSLLERLKKWLILNKLMFGGACWYHVGKKRNILLLISLFDLI